VRTVVSRSRAITNLQSISPEEREGDPEPTRRL
jgi:hypothetical protein